MALHLIIDGYNLIRQSHTYSALEQKDLQTAREALLASLAIYKRIKGHKITVVFDGTHAPWGVQSRSRIQGIEVRFSSRGQLADAVIAAMARVEREKALVVSSDRQLIRTVMSYGAAAIDSNEFEERVAMARMMETKGADESEEQEGWHPTTRKKGPRRRLSKKQRRNRMRKRKL